MRLPNGYGTVYKLSGNRRKPWIARKFIKLDEEGKSVYYTIGYYKKRQEGLDALAEYNKNPIADRLNITLKNLYEEWYKRQEIACNNNDLTESTLEGYRTAYKHLESIENMEVKDIKKTQLQEVIDKLGSEGFSKSAITKVKSLAGQLMDHAMADDIIDKNYAKLIKVPKTTKAKKKRFTDSDLLKLEKAANKNIWAASILILNYTGMRPGELIGLTKFNVDLKEMLIVGGIKTEAGKDRTIPIHPKIQRYVKKLYETTDTEFLINVPGSTLKYKVDNYREKFYYPVLDTLGIEKLAPKQCRHTFASLMSRANINPKLIQELIGHADYSTTANIYTHTNLKELRDAISKI